tara:strand:+ start:11455 stop:11775 length:321 start_codon:yes stop_codon:yes gene_type:complete
MNELTIIDELKSKLTEVKDKLKNEKVTSIVFNELSTNAKLLQNKLDELLNKKGLISQSDVNDAYATLQEFKRREMEILSKKSKNTLIIYGVIGVLGIVLLVRLLKK